MRLNKVMLIGRLGKDPKLAYLQNGDAVANFSMATDESYKDKSGNKVDRAEWHNVVVYGKSAEFCANYLAKGRAVFVEGTLRTRKWQDKDGQDRYTTEVVVGFGGQVQALDRAPDGQQQGQPQGQGQRQRPPQQQRQQPADDGPPAFPSEASGMDDVPF